LSEPSAGSNRLLPLVMGYVAGYVDGCTFVALFGLFVAQLTGSFVVAGAVLTGHAPTSLVEIMAVPAFVFGAAVATALNAISRHRQWRAGPILLALESLLLAAMLAIALCLPGLGEADQPAALITGLLGLCAMGVQNAFVRLELPGAPSTNVMTTNVGMLAIDATELLMARLPRGGSTSARADSDDARRRLAKTGPIVLSFLAGTISGTLACRQLGFACLALPVALLAVAAANAARRPTAA
jgi:uncharacterized membrane protein YoaK (UPF0700 family)